jgi:hypothetical protein
MPLDGCSNSSFEPGIPNSVVPSKTRFTATKKGAIANGCRVVPLYEEDPPGHPWSLQSRQTPQSPSQSPPRAIPKPIPESSPMLPARCLPQMHPSRCLLPDAFSHVPSPRCLLPDAFSLEPPEPPKAASRAIIVIPDASPQKPPPRCLLPDAFSQMLPPKCLLPNAFSHMPSPRCLLPDASSQMPPPRCLLPYASSYMLAPR